MLSVLARVLDPMFARPRGLLGQLGGRIMARTNIDIERHVVDKARLAANDVVLVIGPGPGVGLRLAAEAAHHGQVTGVDPSQTMLDAAAGRCADLIQAGRVVLRHGTADDTGQADGMINVVISVNNVMFWPDRDAAFAELHRVLRPGGRLLVCTHQLGLRVADISLDQLRTDVERAGFVDIELDTVEHASIMGSAVELLARRP